MNKYKVKVKVNNLRKVQEWINKLLESYEDELPHGFGTRLNNQLIYMNDTLRDITEEVGLEDEKR